MIIDLPYISQWDEEAKASKNDCGPVSLTMVLRKYGEKFTSDEIFKKTGTGSGYTSFQQLINVAKSLGYNSEYKSNQSTITLKNLLSQGLTPLVLVQYGKLVSVQDKAFKGPHIFVVTGFRDDGYFVHDPNFWDNFRNDGKNHFYTKDEFETAWNSTTTDGNTPNSMMIVYPKTEIFLGIDLNNRESIKVCVQTWKDVVDGKFVNKNEVDSKIEQALAKLREEHKKELAGYRSKCLVDFKEQARRKFEEIS